MLADAPVNCCRWAIEQPCEGRCSVSNLVCLAFTGKKRHRLSFGGLLGLSPAPPSSTRQRLQGSYRCARCWMLPIRNIFFRCPGRRRMWRRWAWRICLPACRCITCNVSIALDWRSVLLGYSLGALVFSREAAVLIMCRHGSSHVSRDMRMQHRQGVARILLTSRQAPCDKTSAGSLQREAGVQPAIAARGGTAGGRQSQAGRSPAGPPGPGSRAKRAPRPGRFR